MEYLKNIERRKIFIWNEIYIVIFEILSNNIIFIWKNYNKWKQVNNYNKIWRWMANLKIWIFFQIQNNKLEIKILSVHLVNRDI